METAIAVALITTVGTIVVALIALAPRLLEAREKRRFAISDGQAASPLLQSAGTVTDTPRRVPQILNAAVSSGNPTGEASPSRASLPTGQIRLFGTSASEQRKPREMDLRFDEDEIRIDIHNPGASQWVFWIARKDLATALRGADWQHPLKIALPARKPGSSLSVLVKVHHAGDDELEVQAGKWWMWLNTNDFLNALRTLGIEID